MTRDDPPKNGRRTRAPVWVATCAVAAAVASLVGGVVLARAALSPHRQPSGRPTAIACFRDAADRPGDDYCGRIAREIGRRTALRDDQRDLTTSTIRVVSRLLADDSLERCNRERVDCYALLERARQPTTVEEVRQRLVGGGYAQAIVRAARADDPAPAGSILYAVPVGGAGVLGFQRTREVVEDAFAVGPLAGGGCLAP